MKEIKQYGAGFLSGEALRAEVTPENLYFSRRRFMKMMLAGSGALALAACGINPQDSLTQNSSSGGGTVNPDSGLTDELGNPATPQETINGYNNYYEFSFDKGAVAGLAKNFKTEPWQVTITGLVEEPAILSMDDIAARFKMEERIYRMRCVEGWSMIIPWLGFPLSDLIDMVKPKPSARYVRFVSYNDTRQQPAANYPGFDWPYTEGLRLDEARHPLSFLAVGLYQKPLPPQDGAPIRLVVPWKYGFKSAKALVKIEFVDSQPATFWSSAAPYEYGFYSNVNPEVPHPRWSQASERRLGESGRRPTLKFNGYENEVGALYRGMDLNKEF